MSKTMPKVLLIDDDVEFCITISRVLGKAGYDIKTVNDLSTALACIERNDDYFAVIVDFWLGQSDAVPVLDAIAKFMLGVPVILVSGGGGSFSLENTKAIGDVSGVACFLDKPFEKTDLLKALNALRR